MARDRLSGLKAMGSVVTIVLTFFAGCAMIPFGMSLWAALTGGMSSVRLAWAWTIGFAAVVVALLWLAWRVVPRVFRPTGDPMKGLWVAGQLLVGCLVILLGLTVPALFIPR